MSVSGEGTVGLAAIHENLATETPAVVAVMAANNETGVLQPWREVLSLCRERGVPSFCDAVQWVGKMPLAGLAEADYLTASGHKFGGPQGVGFMKVARGFQSQITGGPQEEGRRAGTENVAGVLAMIAALEERVEQMSAAAAERLRWRDDFVQAAGERLPGARVLGAGTDRLWNTVSMVMPPAADCRQRWVVKLDKLGFAVSTGSACASGKEQTSHVLAAMGVDREEAARVLRFSAGWETTAADWDALLGGLERAWSELRG